MGDIENAERGDATWCGAETHLQNPSELRLPVGNVRLLAGQSGDDVAQCAETLVDRGELLDVFRVRDSLARRHLLIACEISKA